MKTRCKIVLGVLIFLYIAIVAFTEIMTRGLFGHSPDGLAAIFLVLIGIPWIFFAGFVDLAVKLLNMPFSVEPAFRAFAYLAPLINIWFLIRLCRTRL